MLSNTILMRFISNSVLSVDSSSCTELFPFSRHVLSSFIITGSLDLHSQLVLCIGLVVLEGSKCITLLLQWNYSPVSAVVINEGDPILVAMSRLDRQWTMDIRVDQGKRPGLSGVGEREGSCIELA